MDKSPLTWALEAIAVGSPLLCESDHDALAYEFPFYDSLYAYFQRELVFEEYRSELEGIKTRGGRLKFIKDKLHLV
jgi:hypothetical protein